jgi:hypothetical protein
LGGLSKVSQGIETKKGIGIEKWQWTELDIMLERRR